MTFTVAPIGYVRGARAITDDDYWGDAVSASELMTDYYKNHDARPTA